MNRREFLKTTLTTASLISVPQLTKSNEAPFTPLNGYDSWFYRGWLIECKGLVIGGDFNYKPYSITKGEISIYVELDEALINQSYVNERDMVNTEINTYIDYADS